MAKWVGSLMVGVVAFGCGPSLEHVTASETGCASSHITISDDHQGWDTRSWTAECNGDLYYCMGMEGHISCKQATGDEVEGNAPKPTAAPGGCDFDTQCKGERVCRERECVDPGSRFSQHAVGTGAALTGSSHDPRWVVVRQFLRDPPWVVIQPPTWV